MIIFVLLGIIASVFQIVILREFSFSIAKNELAFLIACGFWLIFCSLGSITKINKKVSALPTPTSICLSFFSSICLIHLAKPMLGLKYYEAISLLSTLLLSIVLVGIPAFIIGLVFREFVHEYLEADHKDKIYAKFFILEAFGFFVGGILFTLLLSNYTNPLVFSSLALILTPNIKKLGRRILSITAILTLAIISVIIFEPILKKELNNADILFNSGSGYGPVTIARKAGAKILLSSGSLLATNQDKATNEEFIHTSLSALEQNYNKDILFIGTAVSGQVAEIIQYSPNSLDCLQINPLISKIELSQTSNKIINKINFVTEDPRIYLKNTGKKYDAILMNMPAPSNLGLNRYFTEEFFKLIAKRLKYNGIFSFNIPSKREILSPQFAKFDSSIYNAVAKTFTNSFIIPSDSMIIIASETQKINELRMLENFSKAKVKTSFFAIYHLKEYLSESMRNYIQKMLDNKVLPNTDLNPSGFLNYILLEQMKFYPNLKINLGETKTAIIIFLVAIGLTISILSYLFRRTLCILNIGVIGFSSISLNSIIFLLFQVYCGALFWKLGILVSLFMAGLGIGTFFMNKIKIYPVNTLPMIYLLWAIVIFILSSTISLIGGLNYADYIFYLYALICGLLTGSAYPILINNLLSNKVKGNNITITVYSMDLAGAFLGTLVCGIILIPFLGIQTSLLILIALNIIFTLTNIRN